MLLVENAVSIELILKQNYSERVLKMPDTCRHNANFVKIHILRQNKASISKASWLVHVMIHVDNMTPDKETAWFNVSYGILMYIKIKIVGKFSCVNFNPDSTQLRPT